MSSLTTTNSGDAVSKLLQIIAHQHNIHLRWTGNGDQDIATLCQDHSNKTILNQCLWGGVKELMAMPELKELPEAIQAKIYTIVLKAQANFELNIKDRNVKSSPKAATTATPA